METFWLTRAQVLYIYTNTCSCASFGLGEVIDIISFIHDFHILVHVFSSFSYEMLIKGLHVHVCTRFTIRLTNSLQYTCEIIIHVFVYTCQLRMCFYLVF